MMMKYFIYLYKIYMVNCISIYKKVLIIKNILLNTLSIFKVRSSFALYYMLI